MYPMRSASSGHLTESAIGGSQSSERLFPGSQLCVGLLGAICWASPTDESVLIDSIWGMPDGLQYYSHDSFVVLEKGGEAVKSTIRYKGSILDVTAEGTWRERLLGAPWDWAPSLDSQNVRAIAQGTVELARRVSGPVQLLWFASVSASGYPHCLPWHFWTEFRSRIRYLEDTDSDRIAITSQADVRLVLKKLASREGSVGAIWLRPTSELLRSKPLLNEVADIAVAADVSIILEGSILSHAYYILTRRGARVVAPGPDWPDVLPNAQCMLDFAVGTGTDLAHTFSSSREANALIYSQAGDQSICQTACIMI